MCSLFEGKGEKENMNLFQMGNFTLHSGESSKWKIDCDALTDEDYETLAWIVAREWELKFSDVVNVDSMVKNNRLTNSYKFAVKLQEYQSGDTDTHPILIVDDVLTTGHSMEEERRKLYQGYSFIGVVIFARGKCPDWVRPIFQYRS